MRNNVPFLDRRSFVELNARARALALFDDGIGRELLDPFDRLSSPWLPLQGVTPQADDGCVVMKGRIAGTNAVVIALEAAFQGGSMGEVSGAKLSTALDLATVDNSNGIRTNAVMLLETGGVRLQEANLGLAAVAEIMASILELRRHAPVISVIAGPVGCFGGMSLAAALSSYIVMTREARLGMNGPEVIEQESGVNEFDAADRALIWQIYGGEQRYATGLADLLVEDDTGQMVHAVVSLLARGVPPVHRSEQFALHRNRVAALDTSRQWDPAEFRKIWSRNHD
jgi:malonate decarboxylase beta subunit